MKEEKCQYCVDKGRNLYDHCGDDVCILYYKNKYLLSGSIWAEEYTVDFEFEIKYCPMCGRKLV